MYQSSPDEKICRTCHKKNQVKVNCIGCHSEKRILPTYHKNAWDKRHGLIREKFSLTQEHGGECKDCHVDRHCASCHNKEKPKSHNGFFKIRGHGLKAEMKSESCKTCHTEAFCIRCHRSTQPINHIGNWENNHGHVIPGGRSGNIKKCAVCHTHSHCNSCH